jgi:hypothetical protein
MKIFKDFCAKIFNKSAILEIIEDFYQNVFKKCDRLQFAVFHRILLKLA